MRTLKAFFILPLLAFSIACFVDDAKAQDASAVKKVELYGQFSKSPMGAVTFTADKEPDVVYDPMIVSADPSDYLGILVKITGTVTNSFTRDGKTVKTLNLEKIAPMDQEYGSTRVSSAPYFGVEGSEPVQIHAYGDHTCYLYAKYAVQELQASYSEGMDLALIPRAPSDDPAALCENMKAKPAMLIPNEGADHFYGLSGDRLFVNDGQGPEPHALVVYDLTTQKAAFTAPFFTPAVLEKGRYLEFATLGGPKAVKKGRAKPAMEKVDGMDMGAREKVRVDLKNFAVEKIAR